MIFYTVKLTETRDFSMPQCHEIRLIFLKRSLSSVGVASTTGQCFYFKYKILFFFGGRAEKRRKSRHKKWKTRQKVYMMRLPPKKRTKKRNLKGFPSFFQNTKSGNPFKKREIKTLPFSPPPRSNLRQTMDLAKRLYRSKTQWAGRLEQQY